MLMVVLIADKTIKIRLQIGFSKMVLISWSLITLLDFGWVLLPGLVNHHRPLHWIHLWWSISGQVHFSILLGVIVIGTLNLPIVGVATEASIVLGRQAGLEGGIHRALGERPVDGGWQEERRQHWLEATL